MHIKIIEWLPRQSAGMFYPTKKYIGRIIDDAGNFVAETGKCSTKRGARMAALRKFGAIQ